MTSDDAKAEGYAAGLDGKPSHFAPIGMHNRIWLSAWIDGRVEARKIPDAQCAPQRPGADNEDETLNQTLQVQHARSPTRNDLGDGGMLAARVTVDDETMIVRSDEVCKALVALHGSPVYGLAVSAKIEYVAMSASDFAALPDYS